jgi:hypothetical protein
MVLIQLLLPITAAATRDSLGHTQRELTEKFSGLTAYLRSPAKGLWTAPDGQVEQDEVVMVEVVTESFDRDWWQAYAATLRERFQQESIHIRALPVEMAEEP